MKFIANREQLLPLLQQIFSVIEKRQTMPILSNILIRINNNILILTGTDLEIQVIVKLNVSMSSDFSVTVSAKKFLDIIRFLPSNAEVSFNLINNKVKLESNNSRFTLSTLPAENYPKFEDCNYEYSFTFSQKKLKRAFEKTSFCMANQDVRYYLNGLMLNISNNTIKFIASDGHRLAIYEDKLEIETGYDARIILPRKGVLELTRLLTESDMAINIEFSNNSIRIQIGNSCFSAKLVDSKYPDYSRVFNQNFISIITIERQILKEAISRVSILANEKLKGISIELTNNCISINSHNTENEEAEEKLDFEYSGSFVSLAFNGQYFLEAISNIDGEFAVLNFATEIGCCVISESTNNLYKFIVMSMTL